MTTYLETSLAPLESALVDPETIEIAINPDGSVWILKHGDVHMQEETLIFKTEESIMLTHLIAGSLQIRTGATKLFVSGTFAYQDHLVRAQCILPPAVQGGASLSFRLLPCINIETITFEYLYGHPLLVSKQKNHLITEFQTIIHSQNLMQALQFCIDHHFNVLISGGTDTGKTLLLRKLLSLINQKERIITIEDAQELFPTQPNSVTLIASRTEDSRSTDKLLEVALRMRPDRLLVGEIRGREALTFLEAMNTGHGGSLSTIHAETPELALERLALAATRTRIPMSYNNLRTYINQTIDVIIQSGRVEKKRGILEIFLTKKTLKEHEKHC